MNTLSLSLSIPQAAIIVNTPIVGKWKEHKLLTREMAIHMKAAGLERRAIAMAECGTQIEVSYCADCGHVHIARANLCRDRLCPTCAWRLSLKRFADMLTVFRKLQAERPKTAYLMATLTAKNCKLQDLHSTLSIMAKSWDKLAKRRTLKPFLLGWARAVEITYNVKTKTWHPHYHIIVALDNETILLEAGRNIIAAWLEVCPLITSANAQDARQVYDKSKTTANQKDIESSTPEMVAAVCEALKYATKHKSLLSLSPQVLAQYAYQVAGVRMVSYGGIISAIRKQLRLDDELPIDRDGKEDICVECGSIHLTEMLLRWSTEGQNYILETI